MGHFTLEVIGACAFGIKCDALTDENAHFVQVTLTWAFTKLSIKRKSSHNLLNIGNNFCSFKTQ